MSNKKIIGINAGNYGCTGIICKEILEKAVECGYETYTACAMDHISKKIQNKNQIYIGNRISRNIHQKVYKYLGYFDFGSYVSTAVFLKKIDQIKPDIIHLHIMHANYINLKMLLKYIRKNNIKLVWTMHDCWAFTGRCAYFQLNGCDKWKRGCSNCEFKLQSPRAFYFDRSYHDYLYKKEIFNMVDSLNIVTPSKWLADLVKQSFLSKANTTVIHNGIDLKYFRPTISDFRKNCNIENKIVILAVAVEWGFRKGFDYMVNLSEQLNDDFVIVLAGRISETQKSRLNSNVVSVGTVSSREEMMKLYTMADAFVNPTLDDNFPTTNIEAMACGTPVITFNTGGSPEAIDGSCGIVVKQKDREALLEAVRSIKDSPFSKQSCIERAKLFDRQIQYKQYVELYDNILRER